MAKKSAMLNALFVATTASSLTLSSVLMVNSPFPALGTAPYVFGKLPPASAPVDSSATPRMSFLLPSLLTTDKSSLPPEIAPSSCGTPLVNASSPCPKTATLNGSPAFASHQPQVPQLSSLLAGTRLSRFGEPTTSA